MQPRTPDYHKEVNRLFSSTPFISDLGLELADYAPGRCRSRLTLAARHRQQDGFVHAGVIATMADHTAGAAAASLIGEGEIILTAEYKINFLRAAQGAALECRAVVIKPGRTLSVVEAEVFSIADEKTTLVSKALLTMAVVSTATLSSIENEDSGPNDVTG
ncbi:MAG: PaaI family thioesterase [Pseudomonadota bacterium]